MNRIATHIQVQSPDLCQTVGQALLRPVSLLLGRSYRVEGSSVCFLKNPSLIKRVVVAVIAVFALPLTLIAAAVGAGLLRFSATHIKAFEQIEKARASVFIGPARSTFISTPRLLLRPIQPDDLPVYQKLFQNATAMQKYAGGVRDITKRFESWLERWKEHKFSALAVVNRKEGEVIGHVVVGHGDYEGSLDQGWSEMAVVIHPDYWKDGAKGYEGIGTEVVRATVAYARALKRSAIPVPSDVTEDQRAELVGKNLQVHRNAEGQIDWVYLPFTQLRATAHKENMAGYKILEKVFVKENEGVKSPKTADRDLFVVNL